jgi:exonuclease V gamma subunit
VPAPARGRIDRTELHAFLTAPQRTFLRSAFDVRLPGASPTQGDELSMSFDPIERMQVTRALVTDGLTLGVDVSDDTAWATFLTTWAARFDGPLSMLPGLLGARALGGPEGIETRSRDLLRHVARARGPGPAELVDVEVPLGGGDTIGGEVEVFGGRTVVQWTASSHDRQARVAAVVDLLVLTAAHPEVDWRALRVWRDERRAITVPVTVEGDTAVERRDRALRALETLADLRHRGLQEPLPLLFRVTMQMLGAFRGDEEPSARELLAEGSAGWSPYGEPGDQDDPAVRFCFDATYDELCGLEVREGDPVVHRDTGGSRLLTYSLALLEGLRAIETVVRA